MILLCINLSIHRIILYLFALWKEDWYKFIKFIAVSTSSMELNPIENVLWKLLPFTDRLPDFFLFEYQFLLHFPHNWDLVAISREHFQLKNIHSIAYQCNKQYFRNDIRNSNCFWDCYAQLNGNWHSWSGLWSLAANRWSNPQLDLQ